MNQPDDTGLRAAASRAAEQARQPETAVQSDAPRWQELAIQCLKDALKDVEAIGVELPRHGIDVLGYFINRLNAARQPEPVAWHHTDFGVLELSRVQRPGWKPLYAQPPADLKDAQRYRHLRDTMFMYDAINLLRAFSTQKWDMQIDADIRARAMLSSAPTGEKT